MRTKETAAVPTPKLTVAEIVAVLKKASLPTIVVEGTADSAVYDWMERNSVKSGSVLVCGGRDALLKVYENRNLFSHVKVGFLADRDMWLFTAIPGEYSGIIWTEGYSIENDVYADSGLEALLEPQEEIEFRKLLPEIVKWFAAEVDEYRRGNTVQVDCHPNQIVPIGDSTMSPIFAASRSVPPPTSTTINEVLGNYRLRLRGHTLMSLLLRFLSASNRKPKYSAGALLELGLKLYPNNQYLKRIASEIALVLT